jgi:membrane associated rhomboid family serine protease
VLLPYADTPNPRRFSAWVNWALIALNVLVYVFITLPLGVQAPSPEDPAFGAYVEMLRDRGVQGTALVTAVHQLSAYDLFVFTHGYKPAQPETSDLFSAMFLHANFAHVAGNMLFLWIFGDNVEHRLGRLQYLFAYLVSGAAATLAFAIFAGPSMVPLVGASGAISGVLGFYFVFFPRNLVKVFVLFFPFLIDTFLVPARWVLGFYVVVDNLLPLLVGSQTGVAYGAHLGGFAAGAIGAWAWNQRESALPAAEPDSRGRELVVAREIADEAESLAREGRGREAMVLVRRGLIRARAGPDRARLLLVLGLLRLEAGEVTAAYHNLLDALEQEPDLETEHRVRRALALIAIRGRQLWH